MILQFFGGIIVFIIENTQPIVCSLPPKQKQFLKRILLHYILHPTVGEGPNVIYLEQLEAQKLLEHNRGANSKLN